MNISKDKRTKILYLLSHITIIALLSIFFKVLWESDKITYSYTMSELSMKTVMVLTVLLIMIGFQNRHCLLSLHLSSDSANLALSDWHNNIFRYESSGQESLPLQNRSYRAETTPSGRPGSHTGIPDSIAENIKPTNEALSQFLANLTHELRTPMIGILGSVDLLEHSPLSQIQMASVDAIRECGERLLITIDDILEASKIDIGMLELNPSSTNLPQLVKKTVDALEANLSNKDLLLELDLDSQLPSMVMVDQVKLRQVIINLLANAVKFTPRGGIRVTVKLESPIPDETWLLVTIADTGIGIPQHQLDSIFNHFTQVDSSSSRPFGGNGLGLYICKKLVNLMGGEIWVKSKAGLGSTFGFQIPLEMSVYEQDEQTSAQAAAMLEDDVFNSGFIPVSVLLVEDNELNQKLLVQMLLNYGFEVITASNGLEGLSILQRKNIDIVLMDMQMPVMDGYETTRLIRKNPSWERLPIIAITANSMSSDRQKCLDCGCSSYLAKPFKSETLIREIKTYLKNQFIKGKHTDLFSQQLIADLMPEFMDMLSETLDELKEAIDKKDLQCIKHISHGLKGTAGMYGFMQISELAAFIEKAVADKNYPRMTQLYQQIIALVQDLNSREKSRVVI